MFWQEAEERPALQLTAFARWLSGFNKPLPSGVTLLMLRYVKECCDAGEPPTVREVGAQFYMSTSGVYRHLDKLEAWGYIWRKRGARGIRISKTPDGTVHL